MSPELPTQVQAQRPQQCSVNNAAGADADPLPAACEGNSFRDPNTENNIFCSSFYGFPQNQPCQAALELVNSPDHDPMLDTREFLAQNVPSQYIDMILERTPQYYPPDATEAGMYIQDLRS